MRLPALLETEWPNRLEGLPLGTALLLAMILSGCFGLFSAVEEGVEEATREVVPTRVGVQGPMPTAGTGAWNELMVRRAELLFGRAYAAGGYWPAEVGYRPGEWTRFAMRVETEEAPVLRIERTFVRRTDAGHEWWRLEGRQGESVFAYEALIDTTQQELLRLRAQDPEGHVREIPVTEDQSFLPRRQELTAQSIEGATTGTEQIETPAGTFTADRVEYTGMAGGQAVTWWLSDAVPGGVVQYRLAGPEQTWTARLAAYGTRSDPQLRLEEGSETQ